jgi:hypothetical protein
MPVELDVTHPGLSMEQDWLIFLALTYVAILRLTRNIG